MNDFTSERSDAIRAGLVENVDATLPRRHRAGWAVGLVLAGVLAGAGASAGAFAATGLLSPGPAFPTGQPTPAMPDAVVAPEGVVPGTPVRTLIDHPIVVPVAAETEIPLDPRPAGATHAYVTITPLTAGSLSFGTDAGGNNPSASWNEADLVEGAEPMTGYEFPLDESVDTLYLDPRGLDAIATVQYVTLVPTLFAVNDAGQSYGASGTAQGEPELVAVEGTAPDGTSVEGYAYSTDLTDFSPDHPGEPKNPKQALEWQAERDENYPNGWTVPVYESDGVTQIGVFQIGG